MHSKPLITISEQCVTLTPQFFDALLAYITYYINSQNAQMDIALRQLEGYRELKHAQTAELEHEIERLQSELSRAQAVAAEV